MSQIMYVTLSMICYVMLCSAVATGLHSSNERAGFDMGQGFDSQPWLITIEGIGIMQFSFV